MSEEVTSTNCSIKGRVVHVNMDNKDYPKITATDESGQYATTMTFDFKTDKLRNIPNIGDAVYLAGHVGAREWKGKYFTGIRGTFCKVLGNSHKPQQPKPQQENIFEEDVNF